MPAGTADRAGNDSPGASGLVAVCCAGSDTLELVDLERGDHLGAVPVGSHPVHATVHDGRVFVATMDERSVSVVDRDGEVRRVGTGVLGPSHFEPAARGDGGSNLFVPCTAGDAVAVLDPERLALDGRIPTGAEPHEAAVTAGLLFVGSRADGVVSVVPADVAPDAAAEARIDVHVGENARVQGVETLPRCEGASEERASPVFAIDQHNARIVRLDARADGDPGSVELTAAASVGADPYDATVTPDRVFVPARNDGTVHEFDHDLADVAAHEVDETPTAVTVLDRSWVVHRGTPRLCSLDGKTGIELPFPAIDATVVGSELLVSHYDDGAVSLVDVGTDRTRWTTETGANPFGAVVV